ncbi:MAG: alpha-ketoglutarate-dependent dioxygenase AlkB [Polyangiaceae bacterium]|nr:alpha-ketoglutarate-dependent dioxygenase AlkB [Polyangiaceae bacterium]
MPRVQLPLGGELDFRPDWLAPAEADGVLASILGEAELTQESIVLFGREVLQPRLSLWMGDEPYRYSGKTFAPAPWTPAVGSLRRRLEAETGYRFNSVLLNLYRSGQDSMGFHADDEPELGPRPIIASVSLGAARRFVLRPKAKAAAPLRHEMTLGHGSLLVMLGDTQRNWVHGIPKTTRAAGQRLNLTFRHVAAAAR